MLNALPFRTLLLADSFGSSGLDLGSEAEAEQMCTIAVERIIRLAGWVTAALRGTLDEALLLHLSL